MFLVFFSFLALTSWKKKKQQLEVFLLGSQKCMIIILFLLFWNICSCSVYLNMWYRTQIPLYSGLSIHETVCSNSLSSTKYAAHLMRGWEKAVSNPSCGLSEGWKRRQSRVEQIMKKSGKRKPRFCSWLGDVLRRIHFMQKLHCRWWPIDFIGVIPSIDIFPSIFHGIMILLSYALPVC